jgi:hypothetical protein
MAAPGRRRRRRKKAMSCNRVYRGFGGGGWPGFSVPVVSYADHVVWKRERRMRPPRDGCDKVENTVVVVLVKAIYQKTWQSVYPIHDDLIYIYDMYGHICHGPR